MMIALARQATPYRNNDSLMKFFKSPTRVVLLILAAAFLLFFMYKSNFGPYAHDLLHIANYPGAQQVEVIVSKEIRGSSYYNVRVPYKTVKFVTADDPARVFDFYRSDLAGRLTEDWRTNDPYEASPEHLVILGFGHQDRSSPVYIFEIKTEQQNGLTHVTIERSYEYGI